MKKRAILFLLTVAGLLPLVARARAADPPKKTGSMLFIAAAAVQWKPVPGMGEMQVAQAEGSPGKGPSHFFLKFTGGFEAPLHHHTANHFGTVVSGTLVITVDGQDQRLPAGSFFGLANKTKHSTRCEAGPDCVVSMDVRGKWDVVVAKAAPDPGK